MYVLTVLTADGGMMRFTEPTFRAALARLHRLAASIDTWRAVSIARRCST